MTNNQIILEANKRGYLRASRIRPAHLTTLVTEHHPVLFIPEGADLYFKDDRGDLYLRFNYSFSFHDVNTDILWGGVVYDRANNKWAEIVAYHAVSLPKQSLRDFPSSGVCWDYDNALVEYLKNRKNTRNNPNLELTGYKGVAWNSMGCWAVVGYSNQKEFRLSELKPFLRPDNIALTPMTPDECFLPDKWYIHVNPENIILVNDFLLWKKDEYLRYHTSWKPYTGCTFFYPQANPGSYGGSDTVVPSGYTKITTEALVSHVLKHKQLNDNLNNKEDEQQKSKGGNSIKVQGANITARDTGAIRATGIRCSESKVKVGSGHLPD